MGDNSKVLPDKVALVTGAAMGIGAGIADLFADQGAHVYLLDVDGDLAEAKAAEIRARGGSAWGHTADVTKPDQMTGAITSAHDRHGRIDILVNNAGVYPRRLFLEMTEEEWDEIMNVNLKSLFHTSKLVLPYMVAQRSGKIVNISSVTFFKGIARLSHYVATKGGMIGFSRALAREMGEYNIHINCITPGAIKTEGEAVVHTDPKALEELQKQQCLDRRLLPVDIARVALFLASELSDGMTGQTLNVDGGLVLY